MMKLISRNLFRVSNIFTSYSRTTTKQKIKKSNLAYLLQNQNLLGMAINTSPVVVLAPNMSQKKLIKQQILQIYSLISHKDALNMRARMSYQNPESQFDKDNQIRENIAALSEYISANKRTLSLKTVKHYLVLLKKVQEYGFTDLKVNKELALLEQQFYFIHDNQFLFFKKFEESITILKAFTVLNYKLTNKDYLNKWYKFALDKLKFFNTPQICNILYISVFQLPENKELYNVVKLQLFRPTSLYFQEVLKTKLLVDPKDYNKVSDLIKAVMSKLVLSSYERKGLYWQKDLNFRLRDIVKVLESYVIKRREE